MSYDRQNMQLEPGNTVRAVGFRVPARSGLMTTIAADADVFGFRNPSVKPIAVSRIDLRWLTATAFGAAQAVGFYVYKVIGFSAIQNGGSPVVIDNVLLKRNLSHDDLVSGTDFECAIAGAAAITGGTYTAPDADEPFHLACSDGNLSPAIVDVWEPGEGRLPIVLDQNEGLVLRCALTMGASGVGRLFVGLDAHRI
jgi:hypothetical protein